MTSSRTHLLMEAWLDGGIEDAEFVELEAALLESAEMRREFWRRASLHGLIREAVKITGGLPSAAALSVAAGSYETSARAEERRPPVGVSREADRYASGPSMIAGRHGLRTLWQAWLRGSLVAGAAMVLLGGLGLGSVVTSMAFAYAGLRVWDARAVVIHEEGFEKPPAPRQDFIPRRPDVWGGDETEVVGVERNVFPHSGAHMLRFVSGHPRGADYEGRGAEMWRIIDIEAARSAAKSRDVRLDFSGYFNGVDPGSDPLQFWVTAVATDAPPADLAGLWNDRFLYDDISPASLSAAQSREAIDDDPVTWERIGTSLAVPSRARFVVLHCAAALPSAADAAAAERRPRYYVDDLSVVVTPVAPMETDRTTSPRLRGTE